MENNEELTLRDRFALAALAEILDAEDDALEDTHDVRVSAMSWAVRSYVIADAMMAARAADDLLGFEEDEDDDEEDDEDGDEEEGEEEEEDSDLLVPETAPTNLGKEPL